MPIVNVAKMYSRVPMLLILCMLSGFKLLEAQTQEKKPAPATAAAATDQQKPPAAKGKASKAAQEEVIPPAAPGALFPAVVARVNGKAILGRDLEQRVLSELAPIGNPKWESLREDYRQELVDESLAALIGNELIYQKATEAGTEVTLAEVQAEFDRFAKGFSSDGEMNLALANRGLDRVSFTRELRKSLLVAKYIDENITKKVAVTPAEVSKYYNENTEEFRHPDMIRTSHILIPVPQSATAEQERSARERAGTILARLKKGEDFAKLAREYSTDATASQGGDVGYTPRGQLVAEYENAAFKMEPGQISDLIRTQFGFHIIKLTEKKNAGLASLTEVQKELAEFLKNQKSESELGKLVEQMRGQAEIVAYIPVGKSAPPQP